MDFSQLLNTVKDNLGLHEEVIDEEELQREKEQEKYETNLTKTYNINLEKIKYSHQSINILNKQERDNMNKLYENIHNVLILWLFLRFQNCRNSHDINTLWRFSSRSNGYFFQKF